MIIVKEKEENDMNCKECKYNDNIWCTHPCMDWRTGYENISDKDESYTRENCPLNKKDNNNYSKEKEVL